MALKRILTAVVVIAVFPVFSGAQEKAQGNVTIRSNPAGAQVTLSGAVIVTGVTPARFHQLLLGNYKLTLKRPGYETYSDRVVLDPTKQMEISVRLSPKTRFKAAARSLFVPGWGQKYTGQKVKGYFFTALALGSVAAYFIADKNFDDKYNTFREKLHEYDSTSTAGSIADLRRLKRELDAAQGKAYNAENVRRATIGATIAVWGINMLDMLFFYPEERTTLTIKGLTVRPSAVSDKVGLTISKAF